MDNKRVRLLLNISAGLMAAYFVLFLGGYFLQKPLFWELLVASVEIKPIFSPVVIVPLLIGAGGTIAFNVLLWKSSSIAFRIGAGMFAAVAYAGDRLIKTFGSTVMAIFMARFGGENAVASTGIHWTVVSYLDGVLHLLFAAALALMVCVCLVKREK